MVTLQPFSSTVRWCTFLRGSSTLQASLGESRPQLDLTEGIHTYKHNIRRPAHENVRFHWQNQFDWAPFYISVCFYHTLALGEMS